MNCSDVVPSRLPSLLLPCPHCGARMVITAVGPALPADGANANDLRCYPWLRSMRYEAHSNPAACQRRLTVITAELQLLRHCS
jgi:hypothetical protein